MRALKLTLIVFLAMFLASCMMFQTLTQGIKPFEAMTPKEKATLFNKLYKAQYDDYVKMAMHPEALTEEQKSIMRTKKKVFIEIQPLLLEYSDFVAGGLQPTEQLEQKILDLLNRIGAKVG